MRLLAEDGKGQIVELNEIDRNAVIGLCLEALSTDDVDKKQECLEQVLAALGYRSGQEAGADAEG